MSSSNHQKSKILNLVYRSINNQYGRNATITRDPLGQYYDVNKYSISVAFGKKNLTTIKKDIQTSLSIKLDTPIHDHDAIQYTDTTGEKISIIVDVQKTLDGGQHLSIIIV